MTDNPYVVRYFTAWIEDDILYIQTELCEGGSVMSLWKSGNLVFDTERMREFIYQIASGLAIYHEKGLVHLDIKPENIYMTSNGTCKIGDLGLTALAEDTIVQGYRIDLSEGDSRYIAPELLEENYQFLTKADIFSLGMTAYELCRESKVPLPSGGEEWHDIRQGHLEPMTRHYSSSCF
ncbi:Wee1-like protein kinase [Galdieria sulphuraria]|nr:Wee1-like protein kinase [Galdieria sulphuraria]